MKATSIIAGSTLLRMRDVVRRFNVAETTIRRATADGSLTCLTLPSGHRRFRESDVLEWLGIGQADEMGSNGGGVPIACVIRVSSDGQNRRVGSSDKSSLEHQQERVQTYVNKRWGKQARTTWYKSVGSGMNFERREFLQLIQDILAGKFKGGFIVATDFTRICRFGIKMVEFLASQGGCQIVYTMGDDEKSVNESLTDEILSILTHYTAKASGQKNKSINEVKMNEGQLRDAYRWYKSGFSYRAIADRLRKEGRGKDAKGRTISRTVVLKRLKEHWAALETLYAGESTEKNSFELFVEKFVRKSRSKKTRLPRKELVAAYEAWATTEGLEILSCRKISAFTKHFGWVKKLDDNSAVRFVGIELKPAGKKR